MKPTQQEIAAVKPGDIVQMSPTFDGDMTYHLQVVVNVHSWGCDLSPDGSTAYRPIAWEHFELTGGRIVWDAAGARLTPPAQQAHHP